MNYFKLLKYTINLFFNTGTLTRDNHGYFRVALSRFTKHPRTLFVFEFILY